MLDDAVIFFSAPFDSARPPALTLAAFLGGKGLYCVSSISQGI